MPDDSSSSFTQYQQLVKGGGVCTTNGETYELKHHRTTGFIRPSRRNIRRRRQVAAATLETMEASRGAAAQSRLRLHGVQAKIMTLQTLAELHHKNGRDDMLEQVERNGKAFRQAA